MKSCPGALAKSDRDYMERHGKGEGRPCDYKDPVTFEWCRGKNHERVHHKAALMQWVAAKMPTGVRRSAFAARSKVPRAQKGKGSR